MNNQDKKQYLSQYRTNEREIERLLEELTRCESQAQKVTAALTGMPGVCGAGNPVLDSVEKMISLQKLLSTRIDQGIALRQQIERDINSVAEQALRLILHYRYIDGKTFEQIAVLMCYSWRQVCRMHGQALTTIQCWI